MIVRLTRQQHQATSNLIERLGSYPHLLWTFNRDVVGASRHRLDVVMPAIAWRLLEDLMFDTCFDQRGFKNKDVKTTWMNSLKAIRAAMNVRENHPALSCTAAVGAISELIPVWGMLGPNNRKHVWSPYPVQNGRFTVLAPTLISVRGSKATKWVESPETVGRRWVLEEAAHLEFMPPD
jgi:hypothetical protein